MKFSGVSNQCGHNKTSSLGLTTSFNTGVTLALQYTGWRVATEGKGWSPALLVYL